MPLFIDSDYIGEAGLSNLKYYKYSAIDKSPISRYILKPYWKWAVNLFPLWMAPNLITLCGLGFVIINLLCVIYWIPDLVGPGPSWLYYSFAAGLWLYSTFDNVDGSQARRTGTSSPLGELFDHGCDALNCSFGAIVQAAALGLGHSWYSAFFLILTTVPFYLSTWEEYHTGTLYLGYINGPTEGLLLACGSMVLSGIFGPQFWTKDLRDLYGSSVPSFIPEGSSYADIVVVAMSALVIFTQPLSLYNVYKMKKQQNQSFVAVFPQFFSVLIYWICGYFWLASPYSYIFEDQHLILFVLTLGIVFGRIATKIILAHVTKMPFPMYTVMILPLFVGALLINIPVIFKR
ncbi:8944_t:CDS:2 [Ambispora gerdemannii]|uniref:8944_t:CDS:1 n=1 Tax=Ambispora gerdemannii TaxID=144530 RepID=A0A9N8WE27_9GLOM|nr:8944_t:CDS:2 [Ambispora gerdemannii]